MYNHAPQGYDCPFCRVVAGHDNEGIYTRQEDIVYRDEFVTAWVSSHWWTHNPGHVIIVPNRHYENIYDLPIEYATEIHRVARQVALAFKEAYSCDGTSTRQHNEPAGYQEVWHYHFHVFPRYLNDNLYLEQRHAIPPEQRRPYAEKLKAILSRQ